MGSSIRDLPRLRKTYGRGRWRKLKGFAARLKVMKTENAQPVFAVCIENEGYPASLELRKIYRVLPDKKSAAHNLIRVIDESGEDYLYPERFFVLIKLPQAVLEVFAHLTDCSHSVLLE